MTSAAIDTLIWDLTLERPTLGGAMVLRMEGELLGCAATGEAIPVHVLSAGGEAPQIPHLAQQIFSTSAHEFNVTSSVASSASSSWPTHAERHRAGFSYFSFSRLIALYRETGRQPRLSWSQSVLTEAALCRKQFKGRLVCVHLRYAPSHTIEDSNADASAWNDFFCSHAKAGDIGFLLLGDDPLPPGFKLRPGVTRAKDLRLSLGVQLALVAQADAFIGMASGVCAAANFSDTPHVIFKHPSHHADAMRTELGEADRFPFATPQQRLWRRVADPATLDAALSLILP